METKTNRVIGEEHENPFTGEAVEQVPDFVRDAEAVKDESKQGRDYQEITLKFGKGCIGNTFTGKDGNDYTSILIPNQQPNDHRPWQTFVVRANSVHEDKFGKGMWTKLPAEGHTTVRRVVRTGEDENGRGIQILSSSGIQQGGGYLRQPAEVCKAAYTLRDIHG